MKKRTLLYSLISMLLLAVSLTGGAQENAAPEDEAAPDAAVEEQQETPQSLQAQPTRREGSRPMPPPSRTTSPLRPAPAPRSSQRTTPSVASTMEKTGATPDEPVNFDFDAAPIFEVIQLVARLTGRNFEISDEIGTETVTIITHDKIPPDMAYEVLESILASKGFALIEDLDGHLIKVVRDEDARRSSKTGYHKDGKEIIEGFDNLQTHVITIKHAVMADVTSALQSITGLDATSVVSYATNNMLIITATSDQFRRIYQFLEDIDVPGNETSMEIFTLEFTRADVLQSQLDMVLNQEVASQPTQPGQPVQPRPPTRTPSRTVRTPSRTTPSAIQTIGSNASVLHMVTDERLNALIVVATDDMMEQVRDLILRLDRPAPIDSNNIHIYKVLNADAEDIESALQPLVGGSSRSASRSTGTTTSGGQGQGASVRQSSYSGSMQQGSPFEQPVSISLYEMANSLIIMASPQDYKTLETIIARLDVSPRQVFVEATILDVTISDSASVVVDAAKLTANSGFAMTSTSLLSQANQNVIGALSGTADLATNLTSPLALAPGLITLGGSTDAGGSGGGFTGGIYDTVTIKTGPFSYAEIPFVPLLVQAIEVVSELEVLSQPSLITLDNVSSNFVSGQQVPFVTSSSRPATNSDGEVVGGTYGYGSTRVERQDVGIKLGVTPQISEGDNVLLELEIEVSDTNAENIGTVDIVGPTTNISTISNTVLVQDGKTAVLAGLIRDGAKRGQRQVPILGDIPFLGALFRNKSTESFKQNMVVLITPHIIKEGEDLNRISEHKTTEYLDTNVQEMLQQGFFKKVKMKHDARENDRPTMDYAEEVAGRSGGGRGFGRGRIQR